MREKSHHIMEICIEKKREQTYEENENQENKKTYSKIGYLWFSYTCYKEYGHFMIYKNTKGHIVKGNYITYNEKIDDEIYNDLVCIDKINLNEFICIEQNE